MKLLIYRTYLFVCLEEVLCLERAKIGDFWVEAGEAIYVGQRQWDVSQ